MEYGWIFYESRSILASLIQRTLVLVQREHFPTLFIVAWRRVTQRHQQDDFWLANTHKLVKQVFWTVVVTFCHLWSNFHLNSSVFLLAIRQTMSFGKLELQSSWLKWSVKKICDLWEPFSSKQVPWSQLLETRSKRSSFCSFWQLQVTLDRPWQ